MAVTKYCDNLITQFDTITNDRKKLLENISHYISSKQEANQPIQLVYICTHNSRRSHFGQIWAQVAANYYHIENVTAFSGGTEATAFNINAINAIKRVGFDVKAIDEKSNTTFHVSYNEIKKPIVCFSKVYDDISNPQSEFAAIMTCRDRKSTRLNSSHQ